MLKPRVVMGSEGAMNVLTSLFDIYVEKPRVSGDS